MSEQRALSFLGLMVRAGRVVSGESLVIAEIRAHKTCIVLLDEGASDGTRDRVERACQTHHVRLHILPRGVLGHAIGRETRMMACCPHGAMTDRFLTLLNTESES